MTRLLRSEALRLRSLRSTYATAAAIVALAATVVAADFAETGPTGLHTHRELLQSFMGTLTLLAALGLALFSASSAAAEFRYGTIAQRALAAPRRSRLLATKLVGLGGFGTLVSAVTLAAGLIAAGAAAHPGAPALGLGAGDLVALLTGPPLFALLGVAVGFLTRNQTTAVLAVFGLWVADKLVQALTEAALLPFSMLDALASGEALAGLVLALLVLAAIAAAALSLERKDLI